MKPDVKGMPIATPTLLDPMTGTSINRGKSLRLSAMLVLLGLIVSFLAAIFYPSRSLGYVLVLAWSTWLLVMAWRTKRLPN
jgi:hypothetical protein